MEVKVSARFDSWIKRNPTAAFAIKKRIDQIVLNGRLLGDYKSVGGGVLELRFHRGPGYRVYLSLQGDELLLLLAAGTKSTQRRDVAVAKRLLKEWRGGK